MNELITTIPIIYIFVLIILPITIFIGILVICYRLRRIDEIMDDVIDRLDKNITELEDIRINKIK